MISIWPIFMDDSKWLSLIDFPKSFMMRYYSTYVFVMKLLLLNFTKFVAVLSYMLLLFPSCFCCWVFCGVSNSNFNINKEAISINSIQYASYCLCYIMRLQTFCEGRLWLEQWNIYAIFTFFLNLHFFQENFFNYDFTFPATVCMQNNIC